MTEDRLLTIREAASQMKISVDALRKRLQRTPKNCPPFQKVSAGHFGVYVIREKTLERWIERS